MHEQYTRYGFNNRRHGLQIHACGARTAHLRFAKLAPVGGYSGAARHALTFSIGLSQGFAPTWMLSVTSFL